jgi:hypothetical protein
MTRLQGQDAQLWVRATWLCACLIALSCSKSTGCADAPTPHPTTTEGRTSRLRPQQGRPPTASPKNAGPISALKILSIKEFVQEKDNWCWAASAEIISEFVTNGNGIRQCDHADRYFGKPPGTCCGDPASCNSIGWPVFEQIGYTVETRQSNDWLTWDEAVSELDERPFATEQFHNSGGHMVVVYGYAVINGVRLVATFDPIKPHGIHGWRAYDDYRTGLGFKPGLLYYQVRKTNPGRAVPRPVARVPTQPAPAVELSAESAIDAGEEILRLLAARQPALLRFLGSEQRSEVEIEIGGGQEFEGGTSNVHVPLYRSIYVNGVERGVFGMLGHGNKWRPVYFEFYP